MPAALSTLPQSTWTDLRAATSQIPQSDDQVRVKICVGAGTKGKASMATRAPRGTRARNRSLSAREKEVLSLLSQGLTGVEIAERLYLSPETVRTHVRNAMTKLNASTRAHAIALSIKDGEISLDGV